MSVSGNITGNNFATIGNTGGNITGANVISGNTFLSANLFSTSGNIYSANTITGNFFATSSFSTTGNLTGANVFTSGTAGNISGSGNIIAGALITTGVGGILSGTGNIFAGNISSTGNITGVNFITGSGTGGNITGANVIFANIFSASGNITASYYFGNGSQLTGIASPIIISDQATSANTFYPLMGNTTSGTLTSVNTSSTKLNYVPSTGTLSSTVFNTTSDAEKKSNIEIIANALDIIENLRGVTFEFTDTGAQSAGLIAQDVEKYLPELVTNSDNGKALNYNGVIGILVEAVKTLSEQVKKLENK